MMSKGHNTQLVDEAVGRRKRGDPQEKRRSSEEKTVIPESSLQSNPKTDIGLLWLLKLFCKFDDLKYHFTLCVIVNFQLLVQCSY